MPGPIRTAPATSSRLINDAAKGTNSVTVITYTDGLSGKCDGSDAAGLGLRVEGCSETEVEMPKSSKAGGIFFVSSARSQAAAGSTRQTCECEPGTNDR